MGGGASFGRISGWCWLEGRSAWAGGIHGCGSFGGRRVVLLAICASATGMMLFYCLAWILETTMR